MAGRVAELPKGSRVTDYISLGVIAEAIPISKVRHRVRGQTLSFAYWLDRVPGF
jgi:hypothetical protein